MLLKREKLKGKPIEKFYGHLRVISLNCDLGSHEEPIIDDIFVAKMLDEELQREILKDTITPKESLGLAINIEKRIQSQLKVYCVSAYTVAFGTNFSG